MIAVTNFEIGLVAILIGYMVGYAVRKGAGGRGGLRFQVLAALLTYGAVGLAYTSLAVKAGIDERRAAHANSAQASAGAPSPGAEASSGTAPATPSTALFLAYAAWLVASLPVLVVIGSMPSGLINALIIFFGIRQAMRMTAAPSCRSAGLSASAPHPRLQPPPDAGLPQCGTEVGHGTLACPCLRRLIHAQALKELASNADRATRLASCSPHVNTGRGARPAAAELPSARDGRRAHRRAQPAHRRRSADDAGGSAAGSPGKTGWSRIAGGAVTAALILGSKLKFFCWADEGEHVRLDVRLLRRLLVGLRLAAGARPGRHDLHHEMGHVAMLRRLGIDSSAPLFIPGMGALVMLRQHITDPVVDAKIGLAGPVWGLGAALASLGAYFATDAGIWLAIAHLTAFLNLFNLIPIWQLDGSRGFHALGRRERWTVVAAIAVALMLTEQRLLILVAAAAVWRALQKEQGPGNRRVLATFLMLVGALSLIARGVS